MPKLSSYPQVTSLASTDLVPVTATGATSNITVQNLGLVFNVKNYGAKGDGITDDSVAIQATMNAASSGGTVFLPQGTYITTVALAPLTNTTVAGAGQSVTTIKVTGTNHGFNVSNTPNLIFQDFTLDMNKANTTNTGSGQSGITLSSTNSTGCPNAITRRLTVKNGWNQGIRFVATTVTTNPLTASCSDCTISGMGNHGLDIQQATQGYAFRNDISNCVGAGVQVVGGTNVNIDGNWVHDMSTSIRASGILVNTISDGTIVRGNFCYNNAGGSTWGITVGIQATHYLVSDNYCFNNGNGITIDVAITPAPSAFITGQATCSNNVCINSTSGMGFSIHKVDGMNFVGNYAAGNLQSGMEFIGRHINVVGNTSTGNGRYGIAFFQNSGDTDAQGPHFYGANWTYGNNTSAGSYTDYYSDALNNGPVVIGALGSAISTKTTSYSITATDNTLLADATSGAVTMTLPTAIGYNGLLFTIKKVDSSVNAVTVATTSAQTIDGSATYSLASQNNAVIVVSDGTNWKITGKV